MMPELGNFLLCLAAGLALLLLFMCVVTFSDITKLFS